jgi:tetratricopeptide (TPR) repeat protein
VAADKRGDVPMAKQSVLAILDGDRPAAPNAVLAELRGSALRLLADMADRSGDGPTAAAALEKLAAANAGEATPVARAEALYRAGELYRRGSLLEDAVRCLEAALRIADAHLPALDALELAWRERGDLERVAVVLGRKVAATRQPARQKPLLVRLGDLQAQLGRPDVARATHRRALDIDPSWRPSLRFFAQADSRSGQLAAAARTYAQLAGVLASDGGLAGEEIERDRRAAALALVDLLPALELAEDIAAARAAIAQHRELPEVAAVLRQLDAIGALDDSGERPSVRARTASELEELDDDAAGGEVPGEDEDASEDANEDANEGANDGQRQGDEDSARSDEPTGPRGRGHRRRARTGGGTHAPRPRARTSRPVSGREEPTLTHRGSDHRATAE